MPPGFFLFVTTWLSLQVNFCQTFWTGSLFCSLNRPADLVIRGVCHTQAQIAYNYCPILLSYYMVNPKTPSVCCTDSTELALALVIDVGDKAFDSGLSACDLETSGQITLLLPLMSKAAKPEVGPLYAMVVSLWRPSSGQAGAVPWSWERLGCGLGWDMSLSYPIPHREAGWGCGSYTPCELNPAMALSPSHGSKLKNHPHLDVNLAYGHLPSKLIFVQQIDQLLRQMLL